MRDIIEIWSRKLENIDATGTAAFMTHVNQVREVLERVEELERENNAFRNHLLSWRALAAEVSEYDGYPEFARKAIEEGLM